MSPGHGDGSGSNESDREARREVFEYKAGVTDVKIVGQFVAITDHTRVVDEQRWVGYAVQYASPIGPQLES